MVLTYVMREQMRKTRTTNDADETARDAANRSVAATMKTGSGAR